MKDWIVFLVIVQALAVAAVPRFWSMGYKQGSVKGATRLYLYGQEFAAEQFSSPLVGNEGLGNKVWLRSTTAAVECDVITYYTTRSQVVCDTRAAPEGTYDVSVEVDGVDVESSSGRYCSNCYYTYSSSQTPTIQTVTPSSGPPGTLLTIRGKLFTAFFDNSQLESGDLEDSNTDREIQRVFWGNYLCDPVDDDGELYGIALDNGGTSNYGTLQCKPRGTYIASQPLSFIISRNFGRSWSLPDSVYVSGKNELYHFQSHAVIYSVEPTEGSKAGGLLVTVTGDYFDDDTVVLIGGQPCEVFNVSITTIQCVTSPVDPDASGYPGNRGMNKEIWLDSYVSNLDDAVFDDNATDFRYEYVSDASMSGTGSFGEDNYFIGRLRGFFVPPRDGYYAFSVACDDRSYIFLSNSSQEEDKVEIAYCPSHGGNYFAHAEATSSKIFLEGGHHYYMEASLLEYSGAAYVNVGVHMYDVPFVHADVDSATNEEQRITVMSVDQNEIQVLSPIADVPELQVLIVDYEDCNTTQVATCPPTPKFTLGFMGEETVEITAGASPEEVESALNSLSTIQPYGVEVFLDEGEDDIYFVSFLTSSENLPELTATLVEGAANITVEEEQYAIPPFDNDFSIVIDGVISAPVSFSSTADEVYDALLDMITIQCQRTVSSNAFYSENFEGSVQGYETGERTTQAEPFCGRTSLMNPGEIFKAGSTETAGGFSLSAFDVQYVSQLCFGFRGSISDTMKLGVAWVDQEGDDRYDSVNVAYEAYATTNWDYMCTNLETKILSTWIAQHYKSSGGLKVHVIELYGDSTAGFYIDNLYIGSSLDNYVRTSRAPKPNDIFILDISVEKVNDSFSITFMAAECGYGFPLIGIEGAYNVSGSVNDEVVEYRNEDWPGNVTLEVMRNQPAAPPIGGTFDIIQDGVTIPAVNVRTSASKMKSLLQAYFDIGTVDVERTGSCFGYQWDISWTSKGGSQPLIEVNDTEVTGNLVNSSSERLVEGKMFMGPIPGEYLRTFHHTPQVEVVVNGIPSRCDGNCSFEFTSDATPTVTSVSPTSGNGCNGTSITLSGTGFSSVTSENYVTIGGEECVVTSSNSTAVECTVGTTEAGYYNVSLLVEGKGYAEYPNGDVVFEHELKINSFSPKEGSNAGGSEITIDGCGFSNDPAKNNLAVGGQECKVKSADYDEIVCVIAINENNSRRKKRGSDVTLVINVNGASDESDDIFSFSDSLTPTITSMSPTNSSVLGGGNLTLTGSGFGTSDANVTINGKDCEILSQADSEILCIIPDNRPAAFPVELRVGTKGFADVSAINKFEYILQVDGIFPDHGSSLGGTLLTVKGAGFGNSADELSVDFEGYSCEIDSVTDEELTCYTTSPSNVHEVSNDGSHETYGVGYEWNPQVLKIRAGDTVNWEWAVPTYVVGIKYTVQQTADSDSVTYDGTGFYAGAATNIGSYSYTFTAPGTYYYSSGPVDNADTLYMKGVIHVVEADSIAYELNLELGGYSSLYNPGAASSDSVDVCSMETLLQGCNDTSSKPEGSDSSKIYFSFYDCSTASIHDIDPIFGTSEDEIIVTGEGFGPQACQNDLQFGGHSCDIVSVNETTIICTLDVSNEPSVGFWLEASLKVGNRGYASILKNNPSERSYTLVPYVGSVSHQSGSTAGGLPVTLVGTGFSALTQGAVSVAIGGTTCDVTFFNYTTIVCTTGAHTEGNASIAVTINSISADTTSLDYFVYTSAATATLDIISPASIDGPDANLTIYGYDLLSSPDDITVTVNDVECTSVAISAGANISIINCDIGFVPVGTYDVIVNIADQGNAELNGADTQLESSAVLYSVSPDEGSKKGGQLITIYGNGFHVDDTVVEIDGKDCLIQSINISHIECITPQLSVGTYDIEVTSAAISYEPVSYSTSNAVTPVINSVTPSSGETGDSITIGGLRFTTVTSDLEVTIDGVPCMVTSAEEEAIECTVGKHSAGTFKIDMYEDGIGYAVNYDVYFNYTLSAFTSAVECGFGGGITLAINGSGFDEANTVVYVCDQECPIYNISATDITCDVPGTEESSSTKVCDVTVSLPDIGLNETIIDALTYRSSLSSYITSVEPQRGGTGGGTSVTITGTGFASSGNEVTIAGTECEVQTESTTEIVCKTGAHSPTEMAKVRVDVGAAGIAVQDNADFFYIDVWSSIYTWGGNDPPVEGDFVIIPEGQTILLDESTPVLRILLLQGGHMVFDEKDIELHAEYIIITDGGSLTVGTEDEPFQHEATIMLHGHVRTQELPIFGAKVLAVRNGTLDLHGKPVAVTWTHLASTISPGDTEMTLMQPVDWKVGDEIVIAASGHRHAQRQNEMLTITDISDDNMTLTFTPAVEYTHISLSQTIDGVVLDTRTEVGLLTRNVKFRGSVHDEWTETIEACDATFDTNQFAVQTCFLGRFGEETGSDQYGAHIMLFAKEMDKDWIKGRISYIEVTHAGQAFRLGRYPIHFHMSGDITGSYVRGCGIHNTFNRAVTVHGVHGFLVEHNVAYNVMGHAFFLEDGIESGNTLQYNLAIFVRPSSSLLNVDITPAAYWITNPNNTVRHNAAAGGSHFGFWYNAPSHPEGPSFTTDVFPRNLPLGQFYNNSVHTVGWYGIWIFPIYYPSEPAKFDGLTAWEVERGAEAVEVGRVQFHNFLISDAEASGLEYQTVAAPWGVTGGYINNSVIIGYSDVNNNSANGECTSTGIQLPKSKFLTVDGVKFINFDRSQCTALKACGHCKADQGGFQTRFKNLEWFNAPNKAAFKWEHECWFEDLDGTLTGNADYILLPQNDNLPPNSCEFDVSHSSFGAVPGAVCDDTVKLHRFAWNNPLPSSLLYKDVLLENKYGESAIPYHKKRITHPMGWMATLVEEENYNMRFENVEHITNISYTGRFDEFEDGEYVYITHNFTQKPDAFALVGFVWNGTDDIPDPATSNHGDFTFNNNTRQLTYIVTGNGESSPTNKFVDLDVYRCYYKDCIPPRPEPPPAGRPAEFRLWSDVESWADAPDNWGGNKGDGNYGLPQDGDNVQITTGVWMVADVALPQMKKLFIYGTLEFEDTRNFVINATYIFIHGGRLVAGFSEEEPFTHKLHFILNGNHLTPDIPLPNGPNMGSKVLGVFGGLDLHGVNRDVTWTQLAATVLVDDDTIQVVDETDWEEGDEIMVTTTSYETWQTETFVITEKINKFTFRLNSSFEYNHIAKTHQLSDGSAEYTLSAEVGLLTRNIIIEGADYDDLFEESFGARVLVGKFNQNGEEFKGYARISSVQFKHTGQEGWTDFYDPRYSLAFLDAGEVTEEFPSYVRGCSFHNGFSTAIGVYGTHGLEVSDNVIHHVVGPGIITWGEDTSIIHNLISLIIFPGEYQDRFEPENLIWNGGIEVDKARRPVLINNTVAGSERVGFKVKGELCSGPSDPGAKWYGNVAHSTLHGVHLKETSQPGCSMVSEFFIWNSFDYGVYAQISSSLLVADSVLVDNKGGVFALIVGPHALSHQPSDKFVEVQDSILVGTSPSYDCNAVSPEAAPFTGKHRNALAPGGGNVGFYIVTFMSSTNGAYFKPLGGVMSYPAISGLSKLTGVTFSDYGDSCGKKHITIMTNPSNDDASHPLHVEGLSFVDVPEENFVWIHRPKLGKVNPSDCVDMDCDGMKKAIIRDLDGSMLGDVGTVIPEAEFEWDGDPRRGLGDYRIPRTMLTEPDGSRIPTDDIAPNKGIYRGNGDCEWVDNWQAYKCHNLDHMMMIVESMDADTETRRVSPVSLYSDSYIDLINGPQDRGWCHGYTCQERISTFYTIVDTGRYYDLHFTGTSPQKLRYHLLNADENQALVVSTFYSNPQRLDVYANGIYILPTNGVIENGVFTWKAPEAGETNADYYPSLSSQVLGSNYFDRDLDQLFILIRGPTVIEVLTTPVVMTTFGVPAVEVDNFFEENLVQNLANLLDIPPSKIRVVEIISEDSARRRRRSSGEVEVVVEIGNQPSATSSSDVSNATIATPTAVPDDGEEELSFDNLLEIQSTIADEMQTGGLEEAIGVQVTYLAMTDPVDTPVDPTGGVRATNETGGTANDTGLTYAEQQALEEAANADSSSPVEYRTPNELIIVMEPGDAKEDYPFLTQPKIKVVDAVGNIVEQLGHSSNPWLLEASLRESSASEGASLSGNTTNSFTNGWVNFTDLAINTTGTGFILDFAIIYPNTSTLSTSSAEFEVESRPYSLQVISQPSEVNEGDTFDVVLELRDNLTGLVPDNLEEKGLTWTASAALYMPSNYRGSLEGVLNTTFDLSSARASLTDLSITESGVSYLIQVSVTTSPASEYGFSQDLAAFDVIDPDAVIHTGETVTLTIRFDADYDTVVAGNEASLEIYFLNHIAPVYDNVTFSNVVISEGSILITFDITGDVENAQADIWEDILEGEMVLTFNGHTLEADTYLLVDGDQYGPTAPSTGFPTWAIILAVIMLLVMIVITGLVVYKLFFYKVKRSGRYSVSEREGSKVGSSNEDFQLQTKSTKSLQETKQPFLRSSTPTIFVEGVGSDTQQLINKSATSVREGDAASTGSRSPRLNKPRRSPELAVESLPPGFTEGQHVYEKDDFEELFVMVKNSDGTFQKLGMTKVNMVGNLENVRKELCTNALPPKLREKPFILMDEQLRDLTSEKEKTLVASEVYAGECVLLRWEETDDSKKVCICGLVGQFDCSLCRKQSYCSPLCQSKDWPRHSMQCTIYSERF
ncbi:Fibrocystin-L [Holothuria leucospilota]|uniref:Fibrocystin-L n=1 Tax=Holothuria leucospilota TaxID=206669 RepID=A0A9Q0YP56_HOLLE|nr:Fibrocystin-L [Holothuria leucospilota]